MGTQSISKQRYYRTATFQVGQFARAVEDILVEYDQGKSVFISIDRDLADGSNIHEESESVAILEQICVFNDQSIIIHVSKSPLSQIVVMGGVNSFSIEVDTVGSRVLNRVFEHFTKALELLEVESPFQNLSPENTIIGRIEKLESAVFGPGNHLKCFLSYRFGGENDAIAQQIKKFLEMLDIEVMTGEAYEPRKISDKINAKLQTDLDLVVLLITADGESMWTRDEITTAHERGAFIVPIAQNGTRFTAGIFGDHEWIPYESGHISDAFIKVLEAVHYVRRSKIEEAISR